MEEHVSTRFALSTHHMGTLTGLFFKKILFLPEININFALHVPFSLILIYFEYNNNVHIFFNLFIYILLIFRFVR